MVVVPAGLPCGEQVEEDMADTLSLSLWEQLSVLDLSQSWRAVAQEGGTI